jgi:predicted membrane-bound dolichyl-phosphate-mannose-protein mannosyltransferase
VVTIPEWAIPAGIVAGSMALFAVSWVLLDLLTARAVFGTVVITDTPVYFDFASRITSGQVPYRDFPLEYPPGALPEFLLPWLVSGADPAAYATDFQHLMLVCGVAAVAFEGSALLSLGASWTRLALALGFTAISPLLIGPVILSHFDMLPAMLTVAAIAAVAARHERLSAVAIGLGAIVKVYPIVLLPVLAMYVWRRRGRREAIAVGAIAMVTAGVVLLPFAILGPSGILDALVRQLSRPLQAESLGAALLFVQRGLTNGTIAVESTFGSQNIAGPTGSLFAGLETTVLVLALLAVWIWFWRGRATERRLVQAGVASVVAYVAFGKVLSPQYLVWLIPLVPLLPGARGMLAAAIAAVAYLLTESYFPKSYFSLVNTGDMGVATTVLARDLSLVSLFAATVLPLKRMWFRGRTAWEWIRVRAPVDAIRRSPAQLLFVGLVGFFVLRVIWLTQPTNSLIFDETYYVNAARVIDRIDLPAGSPYATATPGIDPNTEHPPLGKLAIAGSIRLFGDNPFGWRVPSLVAGMLALILVYLIVVAAGETAWLALLAVAIFGLDNLSFVQSRIGTLDMMATAPILLGAWLALRRRFALAGVAFAVGALVKITAAFGLLAVIALEILVLIRQRRRGEPFRAGDFRPLIACIGVFAVVFLGGLAYLDSRVTNFASPFDHIAQMLGYGLSLTSGPGPAGISSPPWDWLAGSGQIDYLHVSVNVLANNQVVETHPTVLFQGALSPILLGAAPIVLLFGAWFAVRERHPLSAWAVVWFAANYLPYFGLVLLAHRITYLYYILPAVPGLAILSAIFLLRAKLPSIVAWGYLAASVLAFVAYFPFRVIPT